MICGPSGARSRTTTDHRRNCPLAPRVSPLQIKQSEMRRHAGEDHDRLTFEEGQDENGEVTVVFDEQLKVTAGHILKIVHQGRKIPRYGSPIVLVMAVIGGKPKKARARGCTSCSRHALARNHAAGLHALGAAGGLEFNRLAFGQRLVAIVSTDEKCTNTSGLPSLGVINPNPLELLNHLTMPVCIALRPSSSPGGSGQPTRLSRRVLIYFPESATNPESGASYVNSPAMTNAPARKTTIDT